jgi:hypothetical protein
MRGIAVAAGICCTAVGSFALGHSENISKHTENKGKSKNNSVYEGCVVFVSVSTFAHVYGICMVMPIFISVYV